MGEPATAPGTGVYRPRRPERTTFCQLLERHFEEYEGVCDDCFDFEPRDGPWRPVVEKAVRAYLDCGRLRGGFARLRCPSCKAEHLLAFITDHKVARKILDHLAHSSTPERGPPIPL